MLPIRSLLKPTTSFAFRRAMSSLPSRTFLIYAPDLPDAAPRRAKVRAEHLAGNTDRMDTGIFMLGGALLDTEGKMVGSAIVMRAESLDEVKEYVEQDIYTKGGVWDPAKLVITEFKAAPKAPPA
ncbi:hypothetical protein CALVIDRAFT_557881 [Calocera viscosa TUFC12733]|uniref:YCII-related domain-containing protein n=1 Tax=Calocera viscosa (strain TUFC12733) TaxID=1330018 RepID=A0A167HSL6_CALVF|nr:hypothetical protein CALVIDRAFT_557881 [Calocera viscosa TUFC12733]